MSNANLPTHDTQEMTSSRCIVVNSNPEDTREWLSEGVHCELLKQHNIRHVGIMHGKEPLDITRTELNGSYFLACMEGQGEVLSDGKWLSVSAGYSCLQPPFILNALRCQAPSKKWTYAWVRYDVNPSRAPISSIITPVIHPYNPTPIASAIIALHSECLNESQPRAISQWIDIIQTYVLRYTQQHQNDDRLWRIWSIIANDLSRNWTLDEMALIGHISKEHLRRLNKSMLGRSPIQHLTFLRMQHARHLLTTTNYKLEHIATECGYSNPFNFSNAFQKWIGWRPSKIRRK